MMLKTLERIDFMNFFKFLLCCREPILIRKVLRLKFEYLCMRLTIFRLQCSNVFFDYRLRRFERQLKRAVGERALLARYASEIEETPSSRGLR